MSRKLVISASSVLAATLLIAGCPGVLDLDYSHSEASSSGSSSPSSSSGGGGSPGGGSYAGASAGGGSSSGWSSVSGSSSIACDYDWYGTQYENNCPPCWYGDGDCDCGCQFDDIDCSPSGGGSYAGASSGGGSSSGWSSVSGSSSTACDYDWHGTEYENNCPPCWYGDGDCDCGCQFDDIDC